MGENRGGEERKGEEKGGEGKRERARRGEGRGREEILGPSSQSPIYFLGHCWVTNISGKGGLFYVQISQIHSHCSANAAKISKVGNPQ